jgi:hypothetical protein
MLNWKTIVIDIACALHAYTDELFWTFLDKARHFSSESPMNCNLYHRANFQKKALNWQASSRQSNRRLASSKCPLYNAEENALKLLGWRYSITGTHHRVTRYVRDGPLSKNIRSDWYTFPFTGFIPRYLMCASFTLTPGSLFALMPYKFSNSPV